MNSNNDCNKCGRCCEAIRLSYTKEQLIEKFGIGHSDTKFVIENWNEITREEARQINPWFFEQYKELEKREDSVYYTCSKFNKETRLCGAYKDRPYVCEGYPFYEKSPHNKIINGELKLIPTYSLYSVDCAFHKTLATEEEWYGKKDVLTKDSEIKSFKDLKND